MPLAFDLRANDTRGVGGRWWLWLCLLLAACRIELGAPQPARQQGAGPGGKLTIYTSMYREVIDEIRPILAARLPEVEVEWLQGGSEKIATRLDSELAAGGSTADLVLISDPLWYERKKREGQLLPFAALRALRLPRELVDPDGAYATARLSCMVLAFDGRVVSAAEAPRSFRELFGPRWKGQVTIPDPLASGTAFTTLSFLIHRTGEDVLRAMREAGTVAQGGNSSALTRLEAGEQRVGFVLLENLLAARRRSSPVEFALPAEGAVLIPGPIAILRGSQNPGAARAVYELLLGEEAQRAVVRGDMYSPFPELEAPAGAPPLSTLLAAGGGWSPAFLARALAGAEETRQSFARVMGGP